MSAIQIGNTLRSLRESRGLSAKDVSELLYRNYGIEMEHGTLYNYEKGRSSPDIDRFLCLCMIYQCEDILYEFGYTTKKASAKQSTDEEQEVLTKYQSLPESGKDLIRGALGIESEKKANKKIS